jgi:hypothetical protein
VYVSISVGSTKKEVTFVYQKLLLFIQAAGLVYNHALACISSPKAYIITARSAVHIISPAGLYFIELCAISF